ncbi:acyltransferase domain-containing protein [Nocardia nova]|uniref:acyltransferase domain-containing protein n=1 Tax=Nocardia nova TaxID=37330 RepID=UPI0033C3B58F
MSTPVSADPDQLRAWLREELGRLLIEGVGEIHDDERFANLGLDSIRATSLAGALSQRLGRVVSPALLWAYPSIAELVEHLRGHRGQEPMSTPAVTTHPDEPIAVVGMACRFPGADSIDEFWTLLSSGEDAIGPIPADRWTPNPSDGRVPGEAGFLRSPVDEFDPLFFEISPREAADIDPQQLLFLEVAWEALEQAGFDVGGLSGSRSGVFAGAVWHDHADLRGGDPAALTQHSATGAALNMVANRLSYALGLRGPSVTVDSACSSSLLAVHLACQSLRAGDCTMAVAGGVNLLLSEATMVSLARFGGLAADGRCKSFDVAADGFGRGEGCGVVILEPLSTAMAAGHHIWCVIEGSAVNNDGPSNGLTAPDPLAQQDLLRLAYQRSGIDPTDVAFVEAHGTGTALGDPIEAAALGAVLGAGRPVDRPLLVGSVKTNIGHLEGAAGIAGLIKATLCLHHAAVPGNLHFLNPSPHIDFADLRLRVPTELEPWTTPRRLAGVSSFGWGGTNVHVVLGNRAENPPLPELTAPGQGQPRVVFVCSPHGHQWAGMGREMMRESVFRRVVERCDRAMAPMTGWSIVAELFAPENPRRHEDVSVTQPMLFTMQVALAAWLESKGVVPQLVVGHSLGEIAAGVIAGMLRLEDACRLVVQYSSRQRQISGRGGGMAVFELSVAELELRIAGLADVVVAAINGPHSTILSGSLSVLEPLLAEYKSAGVPCALIRVSLAAHSSAVDEVAADLIADIGALDVSPPRLPMVSTLTGEPLDTLDGAYFARNLREPVRFAGVIGKALADGYDVLLEISANPVLLPALRQSVREAQTPAVALATMSRGPDDRAGLWDSLVELNRLGAVGAPEPPRSELFTLSARSPQALRESAASVAEAIGDRSVAALAAAAQRRSGHPYRLATVANTADDLREALRDYGSGRFRGGTRVSERPARRPRLAFVCPGQGSQWAGMARDLYRTEPVFAGAIRACGAAAAGFLDWSIVDELTAAAPRLDRIDIVQPLLFAIEVALCRLWQSWGVEPDAVIGHSMGEVAAAYLVGAVTLDHAVRVICLRSKLMLRASGKGAMLSVELSADAAAHVIGDRSALVSVAASNSPRSTVLAGDRAVLKTIADELVSREVFCRWVKVDVASHSPQMDELRADLLGLLDGLSGREPDRPMYSTVTGKLATAADFDSDYWFRNLRMPVLFGAQVQTLVEDGHTVFVELSPHPVLLPAVQQAGDGLVALGSLRRNEPARETLLDTLGMLYVHGVPVDSAAAATPAHPTALPPYPWQRRRYRRQDVSVGGSRAALLGPRFDPVQSPGTHYWPVDFAAPAAAIADHTIDGRQIAPGSALVDVMLRAALDVLQSGDAYAESADTTHAVLRADRVRFRLPLPLGTAARLTVVRDELTGTARARIHDDRARCAAGTELSVVTVRPPASLDISDAEQQLAEAISGVEFYPALASHGLAYGLAYQRIERVALRGTEVFARLASPAGPAEAGTLVHPALLDAALQATLRPMVAAGEPGSRLISAGIEQLTLHRPLTGPGYVRATVELTNHGARADLVIYDRAGVALVEVVGVDIRRIPARSTTSGHALAETVFSLNEADRYESLVERVTTCVAMVSRMPAAEIDPSIPLRRLGIDSLMTLELRRRMETTFGVELPTTAVLARPTVGELAALLAENTGVTIDNADRIVTAPTISD